MRGARPTDGLRSNPSNLIWVMPALGSRHQPDSRPAHGSPDPEGTVPQPELASAIARLRAAAPLVHNITNYVVMNTTANALLAIGASPAMVHALAEVEDFAPIAQALVINIGTLSPPWVEAMERAAGAANAAGVPLDSRPGRGRRHPIPNRGVSAARRAPAGGDTRQRLGDHGARRRCRCGRQGRRLDPRLGRGARRGAAARGADRGGSRGRPARSTTSPTAPA